MIYKQKIYVNMSVTLLRFKQIFISEIKPNYRPMPFLRLWLIFLVSSNHELFSSAAFRQVLKQSSKFVYCLTHKTL